MGTPAASPRGLALNWAAVVLVSFGAFAEKYLGYQVPESWYRNERLIAIIAALPVGLLAALIAVSALSSDVGISVDARLVGLSAAFVALMLRAPFLVVLIVAAATAAIFRALGWAV